MGNDYREIKFRAWDNHNKKWLMGYDYENLGGFSLVGESVLFGQWGDTFDKFIFQRDGRNVYDLKIMQFIGITDISGKDIYEGDIVECKSWSPSKYQIKFIEGAFCLADLKTGEWVADVTHMEDSTGKHFKVSGHIYNNGN